MLPQWSNTVLSSFLLWFDKEILTRGQAYKNIETKLYPSTNTFNGLYQYNFPFSQLVSDTSIVGATVPTGLYLNNTFVPIGVSGLSGIDYTRGRAYFSSQVPNGVTISGKYAVKDVNITVNNFPDIKILFETKMDQRPRTSANIVATGIKNDEIAYPVIFCRQHGAKSEPYAFGGQKSTQNSIGCLIFTDSLFMHDAVLSIINDLKHQYIPIITTGEMPFNNLGSFRNNIPYNFDNLSVNRVQNGSGIFVNDVIITDFTKRGLFQEVQAMTHDCYFGVAEFELLMPRFT